MSILTFTVWVSGKLFDPRINDGPCTCNADSKNNYLCAIVWEPDLRAKFIRVTNLDKEPVFSKVNVICHREESADELHSTKDTGAGCEPGAVIEGTMMKVGCK